MDKDIQKPSTSTVTDIVNLVICKLCGKSFTQRGINIHLTRSHRSSQNSTTAFEGEDVDILDEEVTSTVQNDVNSTVNSHSCTECGLCFNTSRGLVIHKSKRHAYSSNKNKIQQILKNNTTENKALNCKEPPHSEVLHEVHHWQQVFENIYNNKKDFNSDEFDNKVSEFLNFLFEANCKLPGPTHPALRYYRMRKNNTSNGINHKSSSNPQRTANARRKRNRGRYDYEVAQYNYFNRRKSVVRSIMNSDTPIKCPIPLTEIEEHFSRIFGSSNENILEQYSLPDPRNNLCEVSLASVKQAIKGMSLDT